MPPKPKKPAGSVPSVKNEIKKKDKIVDDKTFGLKNKKGAKQQKFIAHVHQQVKGQQLKKMEDLKKDKLTAKERQKQELDELNSLFKPVFQQQKVAEGVDPKSVVCLYFKQGNCQKGFKCKFSHDLMLDRKTEKRNMYNDDKKESGMEDWDEATLEDVVNQKHGDANQNLPPTSIICKYFLDAVENSKYGWFWNCPNGATCHYKHALPSGFVLKKDQKKSEKEIKISIEELVEKERAALGSNVIRVTLESFLIWKERKKKEKASQTKKEMSKKKQDFKAGRAVGISGREMFEFNPDLVAENDEDDEGGAVASYEREQEEDDYDGLIVEINIDLISKELTEVDDSGTVPTPGIDDSGTVLPPGGREENKTNGADDSNTSEASKLPVAAAIDTKPTDQNSIDALTAEQDGELIVGNVPIDENLFDTDDLDEDLDSLELDD